MRNFFLKSLFIGIYSTAFLFAVSPNETTEAPNKPSEVHFVGMTSGYQLCVTDDPSALEYCAFLKTEAASEYWYLDDDYYDNSFMVTSSRDLDSNACILETGCNGNWKFSVIPGRENYIITGLSSEVAYNSFKAWIKHPKLIEVRNYINYKIAESITGQAIYAERAHAIEDRYLQAGCNPDEFQKLNFLVMDLLGQSETPIFFDEQGRSTICLTTSKIRRNLIYFDHNAEAERDEVSSDFSDLPLPRPPVCAHLFYSGDKYYRPDAFMQIDLISSN